MFHLLEHLRTQALQTHAFVANFKKKTLFISEEQLQEKSGRKCVKGATPPASSAAPLVGAGRSCCVWSLKSGINIKLLCQFSNPDTSQVIGASGLTHQAGFGIQDRSFPLWAPLRPRLSEHFIIYHSALIGPSELFRSRLPNRPSNQRLMLTWRQENKHGAARTSADTASFHSDLTTLLFWQQKPFTLTFWETEPTRAAGY